jgi:hypothetical protein
MDSELTSEASVKALNQGVATTDSPTFAAVTVNGTVEFDGLSGTGAVTVTDILDQDDMSGNSATALATQQSIKAYVDSQVATTDTLSEVLANGNATGGTDIVFGDNDKAIFGVSGDLQIYHDGSNSYIKDLGTGDLFLSGNTGVQIQSDAGENMITTASNGAVSLFYDASAKLATTSTGIDVTGTAVTDGLTVAGTAQFDNYGGTTGKGRIQFGNSGQQFIEGLDTGNGGSGAYLRFGYGSTETARFDNSGNFGIGTSSPDAPFTIQRPSNNQGIAAGLSLKGQDGTTQGGLGTDGVNDNAVQLVAAQFIKFHTSNTDGTANERMRIDSSGRVGIGTTPVRVLDIATTTGGTIIHLTDDATGHTATDGVDLQQEGTLFQILNREAGDIRFGTDNAERMRIDSSGNVGIGNSVMSSMFSTSQKLVVGTGSGNNGMTVYSQSNAAGDIAFADGTTDPAYYSGLIRYDHSLDAMRLFTSSIERMRIDASGRVGVGVTPKSWLTSVNVIDVGTSAAAYYSGGVTHNAYFDNTNNRWEYKGTGAATFYNIQGGTHIWSYAASGTADNPITFNEAMRIDTSGNVGIGTSSPDTMLHLSDTLGGAVLRLERNDTAIVATDQYGAIEFEGQDANAGANGVRASIRAIAEASVGQTSLTFSTAGSGASEAERMRIGSTGIIYVNGDGIGGRISGDGSGALVLAEL